MSAKQQMIWDADAQVTIIGGAAGSAKSHILQMLPLKIIDDPRTACIMFRRTTPQLTGQGGLVDKARMIYNELPESARPVFTQNPWTARFPNGASVVWRPMQHVNDKYDIQGLEFTLVGVDEATQFETEQLEYMMSRLRSGSKYTSRIVMSCNPSPDHIICDWIKDYYLDEDGQPIEERAGHIRYMYRHEGDYYFENTKEELGEKFNIPPDKYKSKIKSFTFIPATIFDNPWMLENNEEYLAELQSLPTVERKQLLEGNWYARPDNNAYFKRKWLRGEHGERVKKIKDVPKGCTAFRGVDLAHSTPSEEYPKPDYTAVSPLFLKDRDGFYWILGNYINDFIDEPFRVTDKPVTGRVRRLAGERNNLLAKQGVFDKEMSYLYHYGTPKVVIPKDKGGGKTDFISTAARLTGEGVSVKEAESPTASNVKGKKVKDFLGFTEAAELGLVYIVEESFDDPQTLEEWYKELERFDGTPSTQNKKDD